MILDPVAKEYLKRYERKQKQNVQNFVDVFEECYEYALPQRESHFTMKSLVKDVMIRSLMRLLL